MTTYAAPPVDDAGIWELWLSMYRTPAMAVAMELGVFDALVEPATADALAARLELDAHATGVLLELLGALGLLTARAGVFELAPLARTYLVAASPFSWGPLLRSPLGVVQPVHDALVRALRPAPAPAAGGRPVDAWSQGAMDPAMAVRVTRVMHCHSLPAAVAAAASGVFAGARRVLDVGGGSGCFAIALAQRDPSLRATVMELAAVGEVTRTYIADGGVADRVDTCAVDMFREAWPTGYDTILLSNIFHDWDPPRNAELARRAFDALPRGGRIVLHEMLLGEERSSPVAAAFSMLMLLSTRGRQYRLCELAEVLTGAGFGAPVAHATHVGYSLVVATKP